MSRGDEPMRLQRIPATDEAERYCLELLGSGVLTASPPATPPARFWPCVLGLVRAHRLGEFLYTRRGRGDWWAAWPPAAREVVRQQYIETGLRNDFFRRELIRVVDALASAGITPVMLKGAALTLTATADPAERPYGDIDLLVGRAQVDAAHAAMLALGYDLDERFESEEFYRRHHFHLIYRNPGLPWCCFEIHWDVASVTMDTRFDAAAMIAAARPADLDGRRVLIPAPDDFLLHLALHAGVNGFNYLGQIRDVHLLLGRHAAEFAPAQLWQKADRYRVVTPLWAALELATLFGPSLVAAELLSRQPPLRRGPLVRALVRPESLLRQRTRHSVAGSNALALLRRDRLPERLAFLRRRFNPTPDMLAEQDQFPGADLAGRGGRDLSKPLLGIVHAAAYILLALAGWEIEPRASKHAAPARGAP